MWELAGNRYDDDDKVRDVPVVFEVMFSECDDFDNKFQEEDQNEAEIEEEQNDLCLHALMICFHCQTQNV